MMTLYDFPLSGHAHKVRLMLSLLGLDYKTVTVDLSQGEPREADFLALNPFGQVPVLVDEAAKNKVVIRDSNAIIAYLARKYAPEWYPVDPIAAAGIQEWLTTATKEVVAGPGAARLVTVFGADFDHQAVIKQSHSLLEKIDRHLAERDWLALNQPTIADIATYSYIAHAPEGGVALDKYSNIRRWLRSIEHLPNFVAMPATQVKAVA